MSSHRIIDLDEVAKQVESWQLRIQAPGQPGGASVERIGQTEVGTYATFEIALILYTTGGLQRFSIRRRNAWVEAINAFQQPDGTYIQHGQVRHSDWHAMCLGCMATRALGGTPRYPYRKLDQFADIKGLRLWLARRDWYDQWLGSLDIWGVGMLMLNSPQTPSDWRLALKQWLDDEQDPLTGLWRRHLRPADRYQSLGAAFHILSLYRVAGWPVAHGDKIINSVLALQKRRGLARGLFSSYDRPHFGELDAAFVLDWLVRLTDHRLRDAVRVLARLTRFTEAFLRKNPPCALHHDDVHGVFARIGLLAVLRRAIPRLFRAQRPWRDVWADPGLFECQY